MQHFTEKMSKKGDPEAFRAGFGFRRVASIIGMVRGDSTNAVRIAGEVHGLSFWIS
jgi:hypothetical protein